MASQEGHLQVVQVLLEYGASVNLVNNVNDYSIIVFTIKFSCQWFGNLQDEQRDSALIIACQFGYSDIAKILLDQGAMVNYHNQVSLIMV